MAIYGLGTASLAANGEVTGVGTTWKAPLTLIRVGATIVFKTEPVQIYTISEIISDTQINVYNPNSETVPAGTGYAILAHDGITVQGLAQDVAETLRYYQSRETEISTAVDTFKNFDQDKFSSDVTQVNNQFTQISSISAQVSIDADQVASDKVSASQSAASASSDKDAAAIYAQEAANYAASIDVTNLLRKDLNFSDVANKPLARGNLGLGSVSTENIVPVAKGGTGATTADGIRGTLRISQQLGEYGSINNILTFFNNNLPSGGLVSFRDEAVDASSTYRYGASLLTRTLDTYATFSINHSNGNMRVSGGNVSGGIASTNYINDIWGTRNTTVDSNGFIKQASPIVKIFGDGKSDVNIDAEGVTVTRLSEGVYRLTGCLGLNSDASWGGPDGGFEIPLDKNKQPLIWIDYSIDADGSIEVRTYHREHPDAPVFAQNKIDGYDNGKPIDIPNGLFVSVRVNMP